MTNDIASRQKWIDNVYVSRINALLAQDREEDAQDLARQYETERQRPTVTVADGGPLRTLEASNTR